MADFFSRLVERSLGLSPVVQPAIAPRFSSATALVDEADLHWNREAQHPPTPVAANPAVDVLFPQTITSVQQQFSPQPDLANNLVQGQAQQNPITTPSLLNQSIESSSTLPVSNLKQVISPMKQVIAPAQSIVEQPGQTVSLEPFRVLQSREQVLDANHSSLVMVQPDDELANAPEIIANRATVPTSKPRNHSDRTMASHQVPLAQSATQMDLHSAMPSPFLQVATEPAAPPTIRVSIGRVEVRAMMPTPPAPKATPAHSRPAVSLDAYLQQRGRKP